MEKIFSWLSVHRVAAILVSFGVALILPLLLSSQYLIRIATLCLVYIMLASGLNLQFGFLGQMSFGHAAFFGLGAYTAALMATRLGITSVLIILPSAMLVCGVFGVILSLPVMRLKGYYLSIVTMGFCEIVRLVEMNWVSLTNGPLGIKNIPRPTLLGFVFNSPTKLYYLALVLVAVVIYVVWAIGNSRAGIAIMAIRDDDLAAMSMGIPVFKYKVVVFAITAMLAGIAGAFYAQYSWYIDPTLYTTGVSTQMNVMVILGGQGSIIGAVLGAVILTVLPEALRFLVDYRMLIYGFLMVIMMLLRPQGMLGNVNFAYLRVKGLEKRQEKTGGSANG